MVKTKDERTKETPAVTQESTKKEQILELYASGVEEVVELHHLTGASMSYIGQVLKRADLKPAYHDLYTSTGDQESAYTRYFRGKLRFRDVDAATRSVRVIERLYTQFARQRDRAGQHHAMMMALTMANRARWSGKHEEASIFGEWLEGKLSDLTPHTVHETKA